MGVLDPPGVRRVVKRATVCLTGTGTSVSSAGSIQDWRNRAAVCLPYATTRWRLKFRNFAAYNNSAGVGPFTCQSVWLGLPSVPITDRWIGAFTATPTQVFSSFAIDAADTATPWVTTEALQFPKGLVRALSWGCTGDATAVIRYDGSTYTPYQAGAGSAAKAGLATWDGVDSLAGRIGLLDVRLEYECLVPVDIPHVLVIGTSIEAGARGGDTGAAHYESWPGSAALRQGLMVTNLGVSSSVLTEWMAGTGWRFTRADLATTPPDKIIIGGWTNDLAVGYATQQANYRTLLTNLRAMLPNAEIWGGTIIPYTTYNSGQYEENRRQANSWVRSVPQGFAGVIDFDKALRIDPVSSRAVTDGATNSNTTVTSATAAFTSLDQDAGISGGSLPANTRIATVVSATQVTTTAAATTTATGVTLTISPVARAFGEYVSTYPHPDRMGYQRMAEAARFGR